MLFLALLAAALAALYLIPKLLAPSGSKSKAKDERFEAGNPPFGGVRRAVRVQYARYVVAAAGIEALASLALVSYASSPGDLPYSAALAVASAALIAAVGRELLWYDED